MYVYIVKMLFYYLSPNFIFVHGQLWHMRVFEEMSYFTFEMK